MEHNVAIGLALIATYLVNLPFGYWRAHSKMIKNRREWFLAIHSPVPLIFLLRIMSNAGLTLIPVFVISFFLGQYTGGLLHNRVLEIEGRTSRCLFNDLFLNTSERY